MKARAIGTIVVTASAALALTGCNLVAPLATKKSYDPSDGVSAHVGDIAIRNALIIIDGEGSGVLAMTATNAGEAEQLTIEYEGGREPLVVEIPANAITGFGTTNVDAITVPDLPEVAGSTLDVYFQYGTVSGDQASVPVLTNTLKEYGHLTPSPSSSE